MNVTNVMRNVGFVCIYGGIVGVMVNIVMYICEGKYDVAALMLVLVGVLILAVEGLKWIE